LGAVIGLVAWASDKPFRAGAASEYAHQSSDQVTVGAKAFDTEDLTAEAFGKKAELLKYGVLPVLLVVENKRQNALDLRDVEVTLVAADGRHVSAASTDELPYLAGKTPHPTVKPYPNVPHPKKKNPLSSAEINARAFVAKLVPPGDSASGFFYFEANPEPGDKIYVNGLRDARSGQTILYFEFPLKQ
jgi:hypothetical protein